MNVIGRSNNHRIWVVAFLLLNLLLSVGCGDYDKPGKNPTVTAPAAVSVVPLNLATGVCASAVVTSSFSMAMNPASINGTTFTLTGPGPAAVAGVVSYAATPPTASLDTVGASPGTITVTCNVADDRNQPLTHVSTMIQAL
jgi:hypothetical protein